jgi:hypothetical protein
MRTPLIGNAVIAVVMISVTCINTCRTVPVLCQAVPVVDIDIPHRRVYSLRIDNIVHHDLRSLAQLVMVPVVAAVVVAVPSVQR